MNSIYALLMSAFYILNVAENRYLTIDGEGNASLSPTPVAINFTPTEDGTGRYDHEMKKDWVFKAKDSSKGTYTIGYNVPDAYSTAFLYASTSVSQGNTSVKSSSESTATVSSNGSISTTYSEPAFEQGQWKILTEMPHQAVSLNEDEAYTLPSFTADYADVTFRRNFAAGKWNSLCVPFPMTTDLAESIWGEGTKLAVFKEYKDGSLIFTYCTAVDAGTPCLLCPAKVSEDKTYQIDGISTSDWSKDATPTTVDKEGVKYIGSYVTTQVAARAYVFGGTNSMYHLVSPMQMKGYRAYFWDESATASNSKQLVWGISDTSTAIEVVPSESAGSSSTRKSSDIYTIDGKIAKRKAASNEGLKPGIYIMNGMKVVVK